MRMKIGTATWDSCEKCVHYDAELGCKELDNLIFTLEDLDIVCIIGQEVSEPDYAANEFESLK